MRILIVGLGSVGRRHLRNLVALGERDIWLCRTGRASLPDAGLEGYPVVTSLEAGLQQQPQAVVIANPTALHIPTALAAARAGCHLFIEKPISHTLDGVAELRAALAQAGVQALTGFQFRFHPGLRQIERWLRQGAAGRLLSARAHWGEYLPGWHPWEDYRASYSARADLGGGVVLTLTHPLDYLRWLAGEVRSVWGMTAKLGDLELDVEDTAEIGLRFSSGAFGSVHLDYNRQPPAHTLELTCTAGLIRWDNADGAAHLYRADRAEWESAAPPEGFERNQLFLEEMRHFLAVARGETAPLCSLFDGQRALEIALAAYQSAARGCVVNVQGEQIEASE